MEAHPAAVCIIIFALALFLMAVRSTGWNSFTEKRVAGGGPSPPLIGCRGAERRADWLKRTGKQVEAHLTCDEQKESSESFETTQRKWE